MAERLDHFFVSPEWQYHFPNTVVHHISKKALDHCMSIMDTQPTKQLSPPRFFFDKRFLELPGFEEEVEKE